jgi:protein-tyrosine phosphatase
VPPAQGLESQRLDLEGVVNFRDFGGQQTGDGRRVARGRLFRSGTHSAASDRDLAALAQLDLGIIVDLRRSAERRADPARRPQGFGGVLIEHEGPPEPSMAPHLAFLAAPDANQAQIFAQMMEGYRNYPFDPLYVDVYKRYFEILARCDGAVLVHCHAGKDRTGVLAALTLHVLGVSRHDIFEDYLATNQHNRVEARLPGLLADFRSNHGKPAPEALLRFVMHADARYLQACFEAISGRYRTIEDYMEQVLDVSRSRRALIRDRLVR